MVKIPSRVLPNDKVWASWSESALRKAAERSILAINPIIFAEVSMKFARIEDADMALADFAREPLPYEAGFLTGKAFLAYRKRDRAKRLPIYPPQAATVFRASRSPSSPEARSAL